MAKCSAESQSGHDIYIDTGAHPHSSIFWPARVEKPLPAYVLDTLNTCQGSVYAICVLFLFFYTCQPGPPAERLFIFLDLDAVKAHMHVQHK
jgi:hypothetical protein